MQTDARETIDLGSLRLRRKKNRGPDWRNGTVYHNDTNRGLRASEFTPAAMREIRAKKGVGRPPRESSTAS